MTDRIAEAKRMGHPADLPAPTPNFRVLPAIDHLLRDASLRDDSPLSDSAASSLFAEVLGSARADIAAGLALTRADVYHRLHAAVAAITKPRLAPLLNATGIIVHTNLGRAPLSNEASAAMAEAAASAVPLELDPATNQRGGRMSEISQLLRLLTGAEAALVVNNNAAAVLLALSALAAGRQVIVSRGEAVEIGGGFRVPDVLRQSGATLVEVGTTNRTYVADYERAICPETAVLLKIHRSNFRIVGFTASASLAELAGLAERHGLPLLEDLGSGSLLDTARVGLDHEPMIQESIVAGVGVVMFSGDKLLGGPQAGVLAGQRRWIDRIARHPLARAVRADKTCLAGLAETLRHYLRGDAAQALPVWQMLGASLADLRRRAEALRTSLAADGISLSVVPSESTVGGGALPGQVLPSVALRFEPPTGSDPETLGRRLRLDARPPVYGRILDGRLQLDLRTVLPSDDDQLRASLRAALSDRVGAQPRQR
ncbi:MAG: L-seryl-tRNA(Sec) selenium transferase [Chloroflexota bacterium]|nr:L-seryl-tRNA(Sec) selenium transferase [Chloroflexota bacterium]